MVTGADGFGGSDINGGLGRCHSFVGRSGAIVTSGDANAWRDRVSARQRRQKSLTEAEQSAGNTR